jgi:hypothetical protein
MHPCWTIKPVDAGKFIGSIDGWDIYCHTRRPDELIVYGGLGRGVIVIRNEGDLIFLRHGMSGSLRAILEAILIQKVSGDELSILFI